MKPFEVKVTVIADDIMQASLMAGGIQNVLNEMGEKNQPFLVELADVQKTKHYTGEVFKYLENPVIKKIVGI